MGWLTEFSIYSDSNDLDVEDTKDTMEKPVSSEHMVAQFINGDSLTERFEKYYLSLELRMTYHARADGHCIIHSIIKCMQEYEEPHYKHNVKEVIHEMRQEIERNFSMYSGFLQPDIDTKRQLQLFEENKNYNLAICDIFLPALSNCFKAEIVIAELRNNSGLKKIIHVIMPNCPADQTLPLRIFYLLKTGDHYDPLLKIGKYPDIITFIKS